MKQRTGNLSECLQSQLIYVGRDAGIRDALAHQARAVGAELATLGSPTDPIPAGVSDTGPIALLDARALASPDDLAATCATLRQRLSPGARLVCLAPTNTLGWRLRSLRAGADGFVPVSEGPAGSDALAARLSDLVAGGARPPRILVVDDQPVAALFARRVLEAAKMRVRTLQDPMAALDALTAFRPDLVLMDLHMPGVSGTELTRIIRDHDEFHATPIVFLSGEIDPEAQLETLRVGGDDFLGKPVAPRRLVAVVQDRLRRARVGRGGRLADHPIPGLMERGAFLRRLARALAAAPAGDPTQGVFVIAFDPPVAASDAVPGSRGAGGAVDLPGTVAACLEAGDTLARLGENRLAVLAVREERQQLATLGGRLRGALTNVASAAVGLATFDRPAEDALVLLSRAERSLREAAGRNGRGVAAGVAIEGPGETDQPADAGLAGVITQALRTDRFELFYQPVVPLRQRRGEPYEVCPRLCAPDGEYLAPRDFWPAAQDAGLAPAIDRWVLERALDVLQQCLREDRPLQLLIQQGLAAMAEAAWLEHLREQIAGRGLIRRRPLLRLRLAELLADQALARSACDALRRLGIGICIDEWDTTPAVLDLVEQLRPAMVRLACDRAVALGTSELAALTGRLHRCRVLVMVAGVGDPLTISRVWPAGIDLIQGGFVQPPSPSLDFDFGETVLG